MFMRKPGKLDHGVARDQALRQGGHGHGELDGGAGLGAGREGQLLVDHGQDAAVGGIDHHRGAVHVAEGVDGGLADDGIFAGDDVVAEDVAVGKGAGGEALVIMMAADAQGGCGEWCAAPLPTCGGLALCGREACVVAALAAACHGRVADAPCGAEPGARAWCDAANGSHPAREPLLRVPTKARLKSNTQDNLIQPASPQLMDSCHASVLSEEAHFVLIGPFTWPVPTMYESAPETTNDDCGKP